MRESMTKPLSLLTFNERYKIFALYITIDCYFKTKLDNKISYNWVRYRDKSIFPC